MVLGLGRGFNSGFRVQSYDPCKGVIRDRYGLGKVSG